MSTRLATGGRLIDRTRPLGFSFDGARLRGYAGDTLASALLANDRMLVGRSFKYHRPRGILASGAEEPNALLGLGTGARFEPNVRATQQPLFEGATATSQNAWPSLAFDIGILNDLAARLLPAGFYYKTFIHPRPFWKHLFEPVIRRAAGLGRAPREADADRYEQLYAFADVLVAGGGDGGRAEEVEERVELLRLENILALLVLLLHRLVGNVLAAVPLDLRSFTCPEHLHGKI